MRVKIGDTWHDSRNQAICIYLSAKDKENIENMHPDCDKYAEFPDSCDMTPDEMREWMRQEDR